MKKLLILALFICFASVTKSQTVENTGTHPDSHVSLNYSLDPASPFISLDVLADNSETQILWAEISFWVSAKSGGQLADQRIYSSNYPSTLENLHASENFDPNNVSYIELYYYVYYVDGTYEEVRITKDF